MENGLSANYRQDLFKSKQGKGHNIGLTKIDCISMWNLIT